MPPQTQRDWQFTIEQQAAWGTAIDTTPAGLVTADLEIMQEPNIHTLQRSTGKRAVTHDEKWTDTVGKIPTAKFDHIVTPTFLKNYLGGIFQKAAAWSPTTSVYTMYAPVAYADFPDCKDNNEGYFYTLTRRSVIASLSERIINAVPTSYTFSLHPTDNDGVLFVKTEWIGQSWIKTANPSGTVTDLSLATRYAWNDATRTFAAGGTTYTNDFHSMEFTVGYGAKRQLDMTTGEVVLPLFTVTGKFTLAVTETNRTTVTALRTGVYSKAVANAILISLRWGDGTVSGAGEANFDFYAYITGCTPNYEDGESWTFDFEGAYGSAAQYPAQIQFYAA